MNIKYIIYIFFLFSGLIRFFQRATGTKKIDLMRICFDALCFASRRSTVDVETQTVLGGAIALEQNNFLQLLKTNNLSSTSVTENPQVKTEPVLHYHNPIKYTNNSATNNNTNLSNNNSEPTTMMMDNNNPINVMDTTNSPLQQDNECMAASGGVVATTAAQLAFNQHQSNNNNFTNSLIISQSTNNDLHFKANPSVDDQTEILENLYINDDDDANMNLTEKEQELVKVIRAKEFKIKDLEAKLQRKHEEVAELRSHLDKFQSVFPFRVNAGGGGGGGVAANRKQAPQHQRQRAQGISAEPQSESSVMQLLNVTFPKYEKEER
jgi:hypothetical protein